MEYPPCDTLPVGGGTLDAPFTDGLWPIIGRETGRRVICMQICRPLPTWWRLRTNRVQSQPFDKPKFENLNLPANPKLENAPGVKFQPIFRPFSENEWGSTGALRQMSQKQIDFPLLDLMLLNIEKYDAILCGKTAKKGNSNMMKTPNFFQKSAILSENLDKIQNAW